MKKIMYIEIAVLVVLLIVAIVACLGLTQGNSSPDMSDPPQTSSTADTTDTTTETTTLPPETTEPPPYWTTIPEDRQLLAQQYFVYNCQTDSFETSSADPDERVYPASVTKLFTAYIALQYLEPDARITAGDALDMVAWSSSVAELGKGDTLTAEQLVEAMLLPSGNDAAYVLAVEVGRILDGAPNESAQTAVKTFMAEMNSQAAALGMTGTHFVNPDGIHSDEHYMSFGDLALLGKLALENETIMKYANVSRDQVYLPSQLQQENNGEALPEEDTTLSPGMVEWKNTNRLIHPDSKYYCPYAVGLKTGQTPTAGSCLLSAFEKDGQQWIIGVFGCPEETDRFDDTLQLFNQTVSTE